MAYPDSLVRLKQLSNPEVSGYVVAIISQYLNTGVITGNATNTGSLTGAFYPLKTNPSGYVVNSQITGLATKAEVTANNSSILVTVDNSYYPRSNPSGYVTLAGLTVNNVVHTSGNETISGTKTFTSTIIADRISGTTASSSNINFGNSTLRDTNNISSMNWSSRVLRNTGNSPTLDWQNNYLSGDWFAQSITVSGKPLITGLPTGQFITTGQTGQFYSTRNPSGYISTGNADARYGVGVYNVRTTGSQIISGQKDFRNSYTLFQAISCLGFSAGSHASFQTADFNQLANFYGGANFTGSQVFGLALASDLSDVLILDGTNRLYYNLTGGTGLDLGNGRWYYTGNGGVSLDVNSGITYDHSGHKSLNWRDRILFTSTGGATVNWENGIIKDRAGNNSINWNNRTLSGQWNADRLGVNNNFAISGDLTIGGVFSGNFTVRDHLGYDRLVITTGVTNSTVLRDAENHTRITVDPNTSYGAMNFYDIWGVNRMSIDTNDLAIFDWNAVYFLHNRNLIDQWAAPSVDWDYRKLYNENGIATVNWWDQYLSGSTNWAWGAYPLVSTTANTVLWDQAQLKGSWSMIDPYGKTTLDSMYRVLVDGTGRTVLDWGSLYGSGSANKAAHLRDYNNRIAMYWPLRQAIGTGGSEVTIDWGARILSGNWVIVNSGVTGSLGSGASTDTGNLVGVNQTGAYLNTFVRNDQSGAAFYPRSGNPSGYLTGLNNLTGILVGENETGAYLNTFVRNDQSGAAFYPRSGNPSGYLTAATIGGVNTINVTGLLISGAIVFTGISGVTITTFSGSPNTIQFSGVNTGSLLGRNETGILVGKNETGLLLVGDDQTGAFLNTFVRNDQSGSSFYPRTGNPSGYLTGLNNLTGNLVATNQTGIYVDTFVRQDQTGATFYPRSGNPSGYLTGLNNLTGILVGRSETGAYANDFYSKNNPNGYISTGSGDLRYALIGGTGNFVTTTQTGNLLVGINQTGILVGRSETGAYTNAFYASNNPNGYISSGSGDLRYLQLANTGSFVGVSQTGIFVSTNQTGAYTNAFYAANNPNGYISSGSGDLRYLQLANTGTLVGKNETGAFLVGDNETGAYYNTFLRLDQTGSSFYPRTGNPSGYLTGLNNLTGILVGINQTGILVGKNETGIYTNAFYASNNPNGYISSGSGDLRYALVANTGSFVTTTQTGLLLVGDDQTGAYLNTFVRNDQSGSAFYPRSGNPSGYLTAATIGGVNTINVTGLLISGAIVLTGISGVTITTASGNPNIIQFSGANTGSLLARNETGILVGTNQTGIFVGVNQTGAYTNAFYASSNPNGYISSGSGDIRYALATNTGSFVTTTQTGLLLVGDDQTGAFLNTFVRSDQSGSSFYPRSGNPSGYLTGLNNLTGNLLGRNETGILVGTNQTGILVGKNETGAYTNAFYASNNPNGYISSGSGDLRYLQLSNTGTFVSSTQTGTLLGRNETGILVGVNQTGAYANAFYAANNPNGYISSGSGDIRYALASATGIFVTTSQTGILVGKNETGIYLNTFVRNDQSGAAFYPRSGNPSGYLTASTMGGVNSINVTGLLISGAVILTGISGVTITTVSGSPNIIQFSGVNTGSLVATNQTGILVGVNQTGLFVGTHQTGAYTNAFYASNNPNSYISSGSGDLRYLQLANTGSFVTTTQTGLLLVGDDQTGAYLNTFVRNDQSGSSFYPRTGNPSGYLTGLNNLTGILVGINQTGILVGTNQTGIFVGDNETGAYLNTFVRNDQSGAAFYPRSGNPSGYLTGLNNLTGILVGINQTGNFVTTSQTGILLGENETGSFYNTFVRLDQTGSSFYPRTGNPSGYLAANQTGNFVTTGETRDVDLLGFTQIKKCVQNILGNPSNENTYYYPNVAVMDRNGQNITGAIVFNTAIPASDASMLVIHIKGYSYLNQKVENTLFGTYFYPNNFGNLSGTLSGVADSYVCVDMGNMGTPKYVGINNSGYVAVVICNTGFSDPFCRFTADVWNTYNSPTIQYTGCQWSTESSANFRFRDLHQLTDGTSTFALSTKTGIFITQSQTGNFVDLGSSQTITGSKTFLSNILVSDGTLIKPAGAVNSVSAIDVTSGWLIRNNGPTGPNLFRTAVDWNAGKLMLATPISGVSLDWINLQLTGGVWNAASGFTVSGLPVMTGSSTNFVKTGENRNINLTGFTRLTTYVQSIVDGTNSHTTHYYPNVAVINRANQGGVGALVLNTPFHYTSNNIPVVQIRGHSYGSSAMDNVLMACYTQAVAGNISGTGAVSNPTMIDMGTLGTRKYIGVNNSGYVAFVIGDTSFTDLYCRYTADVWQTYADPQIQSAGWHWSVESGANFRFRDVAQVGFGPPTFALSSQTGNFVNTTENRDVNLLGFTQLKKYAQHIVGNPDTENTYYYPNVAAITRQGISATTGAIVFNTPIPVSDSQMFFVNIKGYDYDNSKIENVFFGAWGYTNPGNVSGTGTMYNNTCIDLGNMGTSKYMGVNNSGNYAFAITPTGYVSSYCRFTADVWQSYGIGGPDLVQTGWTWTTETHPTFRFRDHLQMTNGTPTYALSSQTGTLVTTTQTGNLLVGKNQTGTLVGKNETGAYLNSFVRNDQSGSAFYPRSGNPSGFATGISVTENLWASQVRSINQYAWSGIYSKLQTGNTNVFIGGFGWTTFDPGPIRGPVYDIINNYPLKGFLTNWSYYWYANTSGNASYVRSSNDSNDWLPYEFRITGARGGITAIGTIINADTYSAYYVANTGCGTFSVFMGNDSNFTVKTPVASLQNINAGNTTSGVVRQIRFVTGVEIPPYMYISGHADTTGTPIRFLSLGCERSSVTGFRLGSYNNDSTDFSAVSVTGGFRDQIRRDIFTGWNPDIMFMQCVDTHGLPENPTQYRHEMSGFIGLCRSYMPNCSLIMGGTPQRSGVFNYPNTIANSIQRSVMASYGQSYFDVDDIFLDYSTQRLNGDSNSTEAGHLSTSGFSKYNQYFTQWVDILNLNRVSTLKTQTGNFASKTFVDTGYYPRSNPSGYGAGQSNVAHTTGNERIGGIKEFTGLMDISGNNANAAVLTISGAPSQLFPLTEWRSNVGTLRASLDGTGTIFMVNQENSAAVCALGGLPGFAGSYGGLWIGESTPTVNAYTLLRDGIRSLVNAQSQLEFRIANNSTLNIGAGKVLVGAINNLAPPYPFSVSGTIPNSHGLMVATNDKVGIGLRGGTLTPTALLHISSGGPGANSASLKLNSGQLLSTPEAGAIEFSVSGLWITDTLGKRGLLATGTGVGVSAGVSSITVSGTALTSAINFTGLNIGTYNSGQTMIVDAVVPSRYYNKTLDWSSGNVFYTTLVGHTTFSFSNARDGQTIVAMVTNTGTGNWSGIWPTGATGVRWASLSGQQPRQTSGARPDIYTFIKINTGIFGSVIQGFY